MLLPNQVWVIDTLHMPPSFGYNYLAVMVDEGSGYVVMRPMRSCTMREVNRILFQHLSTFPAFSILKSDYGNEYNKEVTEFLSRFDITHYSSIVRRSESQGLAESTIRSVRHHIKKLISTLIK